MSRSTLSVCVLSVSHDGKRHAVGRVLFPLEGELGQAGRVLWRDLDTEKHHQVCAWVAQWRLDLSVEFVTRDKSSFPIEINRNGLNWFQFPPGFTILYWGSVWNGFLTVN